MANLSNICSNTRSQALLVSIIISLTIISCTNKPKAVSSISKSSENTKLAVTESVVVDPNQLQVNKAVERELKGDDAHSYTIKLEANQYLNAVVEQKGIDIVATLYSPNGEKVYEVDSPNGTAGEEPIYFISQIAGTYRLEVRSLEKEAKAANYEVKVNELRTSIAEDIDRVSGFKALGEAVLLGTEGKKDSLQLAIKKYEEAIEKLDKANEQVAKVLARNSLASFHSKKGNYDKAVSLYIEALEICRKTLGDYHPEILNSISSLSYLYESKKEYDKAVSLCIEALEIYKKTLGNSHPATATSMYNLAGLYEIKREYNKALPLNIEALEIYRKTLGDHDLKTVNAINNLAMVYKAKRDYGKAEPLLIEALNICKKIVDTDSQTTCMLMSNLGTIYTEKQEHDKAEALLVEVLDTRRKILGNDNRDTTASMSNLAVIYLKKGEYDKAESLLSEALNIRRKTLGDNNISTTISMNNLAEVHKAKGEYNKAKNLFVKVLDIRKKLLGESHPDTISAINNLAGLYRQKGDFDKAEVLYIEALKKAIAEEHLSVTLKNNLADLYSAKGEYDKAETLLIEVVETRKKIRESSPLSITDSTHNLAALYQYKGDYAKAETLYLEALKINKKVLGETHPRVIASANNLGVLYSEKQDYAKAEEVLVQVLEMNKKVLGYSHPNTALAMNNLAALYYRKKEYNKAEPLHNEAFEIRRRVLGIRHPDLAESLNNLANLSIAKKEYNKAETFLVQSLEIRRKALGENHPETAKSLNNLASVYQSKEDYLKTVKYSVEANDAREKELARNLVLGSERQKRLYLEKYINETDFTLSLHIQNLPNNLEARKSALTEVLRRKGRSIDAVNQSVEALRKRSNPEDVALLDQLSEKTAYFSNLTIQGLGKRTPEQYQKLLKEVQEEIEVLQYKVSERSAEFRSLSKPITLEDVQKVVPKNATLVEFASYRPYDAKSRVYGTPHYVVYLLNSEGEPDWVDLGLAAPIDKLVDELRAKLKDSKSNVNKEIKPLARRLDKVLMQPVRKLVGKGKQLIIAPDGKLNLLPFAALVDERGKFLVENNKISYLTSGRDLLRLEIKIENKQAPIIIGDPDFGPIPELANIKEGSTIFARLGFKRLAGTELEARAIKELFPEGNLLLQEQATEEAINKLNAPLILHIATHGFFLQEEVTPPPTLDETRIGEIIGTEVTNKFSGVKIENPLLRSGIALAGANLHQDEKDQGIFTALKTTGINLWGTKVVVLSACNTGVGEVKTGDGIYGLRRALVLAGSETQLMSLWPVSDKGTKELMVDYYSRLQKDEGRADALRNVQLALLKSNRNHPFYWASFIQSGEWANLKGER